VIRERIGRAALAAYPSAVRETRGLEMVGMALDAGEQSGRAFVRETGSLVLGGLRERGAITAAAGARRLMADSCCQAVLVWLALWIVSALNTQVVSGPTQQLLGQEVVLAVILACGLLGYERIAAVSGLAAMAALIPPALFTQVLWVAKAVVPIACLVIMARAPRKRPRDVRRLLWLLPIAALAALSPHVRVGLPEALTLVSIGGLLRALHDPRLAIACSLAWIIVLTPDATRPGLAGPSLVVILALMGAGLVLTLAAGRLWITRHGPSA
jgi:hypothetical protein